MVGLRVYTEIDRTQKRVGRQDGNGILGLCVAMR